MPVSSTTSSALPGAWLWYAAAVVPLCLGCQWVPKTTLTACEVQHRSLSEQTKALTAENENLRAHSRSVENQLIEAERELADLADRAGLARRRLDNYEQEREALYQQLDSLAEGGKGLPSARATRVQPRDQ